MLKQIMSSVLSGTLLVSCLVPHARASSVDEIGKLTGGRRVKIVWMRQVKDARGQTFFGGANLFQLIGFDTQGGERVISGTIDDYSNPLLTHDGNRVVYSDQADKKVYIVNFDGTGRRPLPGIFAGALWYDASTGREYALFQNDGDAFNKASALYRVNLDDPDDRAFVWNKTPVTGGWLTISDDGSRIGTSFPWPLCGVATIPNGTYTQFGGGCWSGLTPDNTYRYVIFDGHHRNWAAYDADGGNGRTIDLNEAPGLRGWEIYHPRFSNSASYMTMTGPYTWGNEGSCPAENCGNLVPYGGPQVEIYLGKLDSALTKVLSWVKVTRNNQPDFYPSAWVELNKPTNVRIPDEASITILSPKMGDLVTAGSTQVIRWETIYLDDVSIQYSTDGGSRWTTLATSVSRGDAGWGNFPWRVPETSSDQCVIQIAGYFGESPTRSDVFAIVKSGPDGLSPEISTKYLRLAGNISDLSVNSVLVRGAVFPVTSGGFSGLVSLRTLPSSVVLQATDSSGNAAERSLLVASEPPE